jgi:hypothetical protein
MITSINDYNYYLQADQLALGIRKPSNKQHILLIIFGMKFGNLKNF